MKKEQEKDSLQPVSPANVNFKEEFYHESESRRYP
jgi:hypothetical protein